MSFDYSNPNTNIYSQAGKAVQAKSFKIDLAAANAATGVATFMGYLPKDSQIVALVVSTPTAVSGPSVSAATLALTANGTAFASAINVFVTGTSSNSLSSSYMGAFPNPTLNDVALRFALTLTGGATATAGVIYVNVLYVV